MKFCIVCLESRKIIVHIFVIIIYQEPNICDISCDISLYTRTPIYGLFKSYPIVLHFSQVLSESRRQSVLPPQSLQSESWAGQKVVDKYLGDRHFGLIDGGAPCLFIMCSMFIVHVYNV